MDTFSFFTGSSIQHRQIKNIFNKYSNVLKNDWVLGPVLPDRARVIYKGAPLLKGRVAPNIINPLTKSSFSHNLMGSYPCRKCIVCCHNVTLGRRVESFGSTVTNRTYSNNSPHVLLTTYLILILLELI